MTEIVIQGIGGRMGHVLCDMIAQREDCCVVAGIDVKDGEQNGIPVYDSLEKLNGKGDVVIDISSPAAVEKALPYCEAHKLPLVVAHDAAAAYRADADLLRVTLLTHGGTIVDIVVSTIILLVDGIGQHQSSAAGGIQLV